jgi:hypothetical protein
MSKARLGSLSRRYSFFLNPYPDERFSRCPKCRRLTNFRKFAFLIHVDPKGLIPLRKTSRYCPVCELIIVHQDELEPQLLSILSKHDLGRVGNPYFVIGTLDLNAWKTGIQTSLTFEQIREQTADFKYQLTFTPSDEP